MRRTVLEVLLLVAPGLYRFRLRRRSGEPYSCLSVQLKPVASRRKRILVVDHDFPEADRDAGSRAIACFVSMLKEAGSDVCFWAATTAPSSRGRSVLAKRGIEALALADTGSLEVWLHAGGAHFDACVVSRPLMGAMYMAILKAEIRGPCIYYGHDIHHNRLKAQRLALAGRRGFWDMYYNFIIERRLWRGADVVLYPSQEEADTVNRYLEIIGRRPNAEFFPLWTFRTSRHFTEPALPQRRGILFVGSHTHAPNIDGLNWFLREVAPFLRARAPTVSLTIVGSGMNSYLPPETDVLMLRLIGHIDDRALDEEYAAARVVIAPLRYGAGVKGKVLEAINHGVPCVLTDAAAQGLGGLKASLPVTDDPLAYAKALVTLLTDDNAWHSASKGAASWLAEAYSHERFIERLRALIGVTPSFPGAASKVHGRHVRD